LGKSPWGGDTDAAIALAPDPLHTTSGKKKTYGSFQPTPYHVARVSPAILPQVAQFFAKKIRKNH